MWDSNNNYWGVRSSVDSTSFPFLQTNVLPNSGAGYECPSAVPYDDWKMWTGSWPTGVGVVCTPTYEDMCPCDTLEVAADASEATDYTADQAVLFNSILGSWTRIADPGHVENGGRPVFQNGNLNIYWHGGHGGKW